jgi:glycine/D-amino acid oxidase-like deaminating enzyme
VVGLAVAYWLSEDGIAVTVVDRDPSGDKASFGNAAGIAVTEVVPASVPGLAWRVPGWLVDPLALQLLSLWTSESMGNHDSNVMGGANSVD